MTNYNNGDSAENSAFIVILMTLVLLVIIMVLYQAFRLEINTMLGWLIQGQLAPFVPFLEVPQKVWGWFGKVDLGEQSFDVMMALMRVAGRYFRWLCLPFFLVLLIRGVFGGVVWRYCYTMTAERLIAENAKFLPCLRPVVDKNLLAEAIDHGPWRAARQALQFAVENRLLMLERDGKRIPVDSDVEPGKKGLVLGRSGIPREDSPCLLGHDGTVSREFALHFEEQKALEIFKVQLGATFESADSMPAHALGLAAAFMAFGVGDKEVCQTLLDHMSTTFQERKIKNLKARLEKFLSIRKQTTGQEELAYALDIGNARDVFEKYAEHEDIVSIRAAHGAFLSTFLMALFSFAKDKGVLACSQFIWLRPYDRTLWYTLNQVGGKAAWTEGAGPWAHYLFEEKMGEAVPEPQCVEAVNALRYVLEQEGWLPPVVTARKKFAAPPETTPQLMRNRDGLGERRLIRGGGR